MVEKFFFGRSRKRWRFSLWRSENVEDVQGIFISKNSMCVVRIINNFREKWKRNASFINVISTEHVAMSCAYHILFSTPAEYGNESNSKLFYFVLTSCSCILYITFLYFAIIPVHTCVHIYNIYIYSTPIPFLLFRWPLPLSYLLTDWQRL